MTQADFSIIDKKVGLLGGTALVIGNVVAMTVFFLPARLVARGVGPSMALGMLIVSVVVAIGLIGRFQVGGAMPTAGGSYVYATRLIHPYFGFLLPWVMIPALWLGQLFLAFGFADFVRYYDVFAGVPMFVLMYAALLPFLVMNVLGIRIVTLVQMLLVGVILLGMVLFVVPGAFRVDPGNLTPLVPPPGEYDSFFIGLVSLAIAMNGFGLATDLGEEIEDPVKNIPRVLALSAIISLTLMMAVIVVAMGVVETSFYVTDSGDPIHGGVAAAASEFLGSWGGGFVAIAAIIGALTTVNTLYTSSSRSIMRAARDELLPKSLAKIHPRFETPHRAILLVGIPPLFVVPFEPDPTDLALMMAMAGLLGSVFSAIALWNLPKRFPERYENAYYRLPLPVLKGVALVSGLTSLGLAVAVSTSLWWLALAVGGYMAAGFPVYIWRVKSLGKRGIDLPERMKDLHDHEIERAEAGQLYRGEATADDADTDAAPTGTDD